MACYQTRETSPNKLLGKQRHLPLGINPPAEPPSSGMQQINPGHSAAKLRALEVAQTNAGSNCKQETEDQDAHSKVCLLRKEVITVSTSLFTINAVTCVLHMVKKTPTVFWEESIHASPWAWCSVNALLVRAVLCCDPFPIPGEWVWISWQKHRSHIDACSSAKPSGDSLIIAGHVQRDRAEGRVHKWGIVTQFPPFLIPSSFTHAVFTLKLTSPSFHLEPCYTRRKPSTPQPQLMLVPGICFFSSEAL